MKFYRVFPADPNAALTEKGGALFAPRSSAGRADNPDLYRTLYVSDRPEGAVAETLGRLAIWRQTDFVHASGHRMTLATYECPDALRICDLDDTDVLATVGIRRPSRVITRDRNLTQAWARRIYEARDYAGVQWWCYYDPDWRSIALWDLSKVIVDPNLDSLDAKHPIVKAAAAAIVRQIDSR